MDDVDKEVALLKQELNNFSINSLVKSKEILLELYDYSIQALKLEFVKKAKLFDPLYQRSKAHAVVDSRGGELVSLKDIRAIIKKNTDEVRIEFIYVDFKHPYIEEFSFWSKITFQFNHTSFSVSNYAEVLVEKPYGEQLSSEEISQVVNAEIRRHNAYIVEKMEETK